MIINSMIESKWLNPNGLIILEHLFNNILFKKNKYHKITRQYGNISFSFFEYL